MPANSAFLSCVLRLQIRDRNFCGRGAFGARVVGRTRKRGCVSEFFALRRLQVSTGNIAGGTPATTDSSNATGKQPTPSAIETAVPGEFREIRRIGRCGVGVAKWKT